MGNWGISEKATEKEKIKSQMADFLGGFNYCGELSYNSYSELFDFSMELLDRMYELGKSESSKTVNINEITTFDNRKYIK